MSTQTTAASPSSSHPIQSTLVPARMDRLPWSHFHWTVLVGLGFCWILDGLSVQIVASAGYQKTLEMSSTQVGMMGTIYLVGQVLGALVFGWLSDRYGRRKIFILTLVLYLVGTAISGLAMNWWFLGIFRFISGLGIGGEYSAINSAIDEFIPSKYRGRIDIMINGTYWGGAMLGSVANLFFLNTDYFSVNWGWRIAFFIGPAIGLFIIWVRRTLPESPRWLMTHGRVAEAEATVDTIEADVIKHERHHHGNASFALATVPASRAIRVKAEGSVPFGIIMRVLFRQYPRRTLTGVTMMVTQSFLYNAIFFTYALVLQNFYHTTPSSTQYYFFPFAVGNLLGPLILGRFFDTWGRRQMIFLTYLVSGLVLAVSAVLFEAGVLNALTQTIFWCVSFFFASAGASAAYLTVSEVFPLEVRSQVISYLFAIGQIVGAIAPTVFGAMIGDGKHTGPLTAGYFLGAGLMIIGGIVALIFGVDAAGKSLEDITDPLTLAAKKDNEEEAEFDSAEHAAETDTAAERAAREKARADARAAHAAERAEIAQDRKDSSRSRRSIAQASYRPDSSVLRSQRHHPGGSGSGSGGAGGSGGSGK